MGNRTAAGITCCATLLSAAKVSIGAPIALANIAASKSWFAFMMDASKRRSGEFRRIQIHRLLIA
jgi:hypothetical protein